ncbi:MAG TPA: MFS transporter [Streptosporangiaceae bacterium]|nr:MFS transporter [Streptosporangiaceae bacterium]
MTEATVPPGASFLATRKGQLTLAFLLMVALLDFMGIAIVNVALPSIQRDLHFSQQNLQWVLSGYTVTYGGFLLLGGRLADLLGRRVTLVIGTAVFAVTSVLGGAAPNAGTLVGARLAQGIGAALMTPAALSILTTSFNTGTDRVKALGAWGAMGGFSGVLGVFLGGVISAGPGWRWVLYINVPICAVVIIAAYLLIGGEAPRRSGLASFDTPGALLGTGGMLLLIYALVKAPDNGWGSAQTIGELAGAAVLMAALVINELRHPNPVLPLSIFRVKGLAATDAAQVLGLAGLNSAFFFISLYMQEVLHFSALRAGAAYVPIAAIVMAGSIGGSGLVPRLGTRPLIVAGAVIATGGLYWVSRIPVHGHYWTDIFPPLMITGLGLGLVFVGVQIAANAGVPPDKAGLAGALITASFQVGVALGLAILSALATARTHSLLSAHHPVPDAIVGGFTRALLAATFFTGAVVLIGLRAANTKGEPSGGTTAEITGIAGTNAVSDSAQPRALNDEETTLPG